MNPIVKLAKSYSKGARARRAEEFRTSFLINENTRILDLGSEAGSNIHTVLEGTAYNKNNVYIADINLNLIEKGAKKYGFVPVLIDESDRLPFEDGFFDIVYCSSVIEHVTIPKSQIWTLFSGKEFRSRALNRQAIFANEIRRVSKAYFVQTPYRYFPIESHSWLPFFAWLPRWLIILILRISNTFWVKKTSPDWYLLTKAEMSSLFPEANILFEKSLGFPKSLMAIKNDN